MKFFATRRIVNCVDSDPKFSKFVNAALKIQQDNLSGGVKCLSQYENEGKTIWIVTDPHRSVTTIFFPEEYWGLVFRRVL